MKSNQRIGNPVVVMPTISMGWVLLAFALSLPWLMPIHKRPWTGFHADALMALVIIAALAVVFLKTRGRWTFPTSSAVIVGLSFVPLLQHLYGMIYFSADAFMASAYLFALGFAVLLGRRMEDYWPGRLVPAVFASFGIAAVVSFAIALNQWLQLDPWGLYTMSISAGSRPVANVAQPNKLATLYLWGLVAFWWAFRGGVVRGWLTVLVAALLLFGIAMTQSRMGAVAVLAVMAIALFHPQALSKKTHRWVVVGLFIWFVAWVLGWSTLNVLLGLSSQSLGERLRPGTRLLHWQLIADAILQRPLLGWGWQQTSVAQSSLALDHPATGEVIRSSHNLVLDLLLWNGLPLGLLLSFGIGAWFVGNWRRTRHPTETLVMVVLSVFLLHSLLEIPHIAATFLLPAGLLVGTLSVSNSQVSKTGPWSAREGVVAAAVLALALCLFLVARDYFKIEAAWTAERLRVARIGSLVPTPLPDAPSLGQLSAVLELGRIEPRAGMTSEEIEAMRQITYRMPGVGGMLKLAHAQALNGQSAEAKMTLGRLCQIRPPSTCNSALRAWSEMVSTKGSGEHADVHLD
jgi:hypothetical protein